MCPSWRTGNWVSRCRTWGLSGGGGDWDVLGYPSWDLAGGCRCGCMAAVPGCCRDIPSSISMGVMGRCLWPHRGPRRYAGGIPATWYGCRSGRSTFPGRVGFRLPTPPRPAGAGGRGGQSLIDHQQHTPEPSRTAMVSAESPVGTPWVSVCLSAPGRPAQRERNSPGQCRRSRCEPSGHCESDTSPRLGG